MIEAPELLGIPFLLGGRSYEGADCWGLCDLLCRKLGVELQDPWAAICEQWGAAWDASSAHVPAGWKALPPDTEPEPLDILIVEQRGAANHVAIVVGDGYVLHAARGTVSHLLQFRKLRPRLRAIWRCAS